VAESQGRGLHGAAGNPGVGGPGDD
jgi:hypothetical protein